MPLIQFTLESLKNLDDGKAVIAFQNHIQRAALDCLDRSADKTKRKVTLEIQVTPDPDDDGVCDRVKVQIQAKSSVPVQKTRPYNLRLHKNGSISFNPDSPTNVNQQTLLGDSDTE